MKIKYIGPPGMFNALIGNLTPEAEYTVTEEDGKALCLQPFFIEVKPSKNKAVELETEVNNG